MKLRTTHNSIRIRLRRSELELLQQDQKVEESIRFPAGTLFRFAISIVESADRLSATLQDNYLLLSIPPALASDWISTNRVGIESHIDLYEGEQLHLLIEKDFPCNDRPGEDKSDTFWELAPDGPPAC